MRIFTRIGRAVVHGTVVGVFAASMAQAGASACPGDCDGDQQILITELIRGLRIALGISPLQDCPTFDLNGDGIVDVSEVLTAVSAAVRGCPGQPTHTASVTRTITPTRTNTATATTSPTPPPPSLTPRATDTAPHATDTATAGPTATEMPVTPASPSVTAINTPTPTMTDTDTATPTATATSTTSPTQTRTARPPAPLSMRVCGNGQIEPGEECDDSNRTGGDGCNEHCRSESHPDPCADITPVSGTQVIAVRVASGLSLPLHVTAPPHDFERLFIVEQGGRIRLLKDGQLLPEPFLDLRTRVSSGGERGLLSLAFHPLYHENGTFFVDYTVFRGDTLVSVISRFHVSDDPDRADPNSEEILIEVDQPFVAHNGGQLAFDADGYLYVAFGDGGRSASTQNTAQDPQVWFGKILRIDVDAAVPYAIPADNPYAGSESTLGEIWVNGLRNPWRFSFDRATGDMYIGDVGEQALEEVNVVPAGSAGQNFGWCCREGSVPFGRCFQAATTCPAEGLVSPVVEYGHDAGCSVTGGFVYRGCALPDLRGTYFYGDYCEGFVRSFVYVDGAATDPRDWTLALTPPVGTINRITSFGEDARGELYIADPDGEVYKLVPASDGLPIP